MRSPGEPLARRRAWPVAALRYIYFRIYSSLLRKFGAHDYPHVSALLATTFLTCLNVLSIPVALGAMGGLAISPDTFRILVLIVLAVVFFLNYVLLFRGRRYEAIAIELADDNHRVHRWRTIAVWAYVIGSFGAFYGVLMLGAIARSHSTP